MPRVVEVSVASERTQDVIDKIKDLDGILGLSVQQGSSVDPPGDVVRIQATNDTTHELLRRLVALDLFPPASVSTAELRSIWSPSEGNKRAERESSETIWEEMAFLLRRETNTSYNYLLLMALSGAIASIGLWTDTLHLVIGAMIIAPGFEPLLRLPFAVVTGPSVEPRLAARSVLSGNVMLAAGAAVMFALLRLVDGSPPDLASRALVRYWTTTKGSDVLLAVAAAAAGAITITGQRAVLSAGVMVALALVPGMSIAGMALLAGDLDLAGRGLGRWGLDAAAVIVVSFVVLTVKQRLIHRRQLLA